jgi:membrane protease YdiL (CAAX protease family)
MAKMVMPTNWATTPPAVVESSYDLRPTTKTYALTRPMFPYASELNLAGWFHLAYFGVVLPFFAVLNRKKLAGDQTALPSRLRHFQTTAFLLVVFGGLSLVVANVQWIFLFPPELPTAGAMAAGVAAYVAAVAYMRPNWRRAVETRARAVHLFMPANDAERSWWVVVAVLAGISEEITWRGTQAALLNTLTGNFWIASLLSSCSFALLHIIQGRKSAATVAVFAMGFHALVWLAGSLYVAMAVHIAYDLTAGFSYGRLGRELGYDPATPGPPGDVAGLPSANGP